MSGSERASRPHLLALLLAAASGLAGHAQKAHALAVEEASIADIQAAYREGRVTAHEIVAASLARIAAYDKKGPYINSIITVNPKALEEADAVDAKYKATGKFIGPLQGIPVVLKDNLDATGMPMTNGFQGWKNYYPPSDAPLVARIKAAGGVIIGKTGQIIRVHRGYSEAGVDDVINDLNLALAQ